MSSFNKVLSCGIDFGTSNSSVAIAHRGKIELVAVEGQEVTIPTAIFFQPGLPPLFGRQATRWFFERHEGRFMRSLKRVLGTPLMKQGTVINGKAVKFERIIASFLAHLRASTITSAGEPVENVVMGRPVHFIDNNSEGDQRAQDELKVIAQTVGFRHVEFQFEPIAAAFAHEVKIEAEQLALVADLGGGTSDFTVIKVSKKNVSKRDRSSDILGNSGVRVGGNDFDKELVLAAIMPEIGYRSTYGSKNLEVPLKYYHDLAEWSKVNFLYTPKTLSHARELFNQSHDPVRFGRLLKILEDESGHALLAVAEDAKIALTNSESISAPMDFLEPRLSIPMTRKVFQDSIANEVEKIAGSAKDCLRQAGVTADQIQLVILTGGSTEIPMVRKAFIDLFPTAQIADENKLSSVGLGLAYDSERRFR
ncbi:MAG TPA: Hsp70 family protein [Chryseosolibacter sp.]